MATTTSTSSTQTGSSIAYQLGAGSGIDVKTLVTNLTEAQKAPKQSALTMRTEKNTAQISAIADLASAIDTFSTALSTLISGGTLFTQPTVSDDSILSAKTIAGSQIGDLAASIEVVQLAKAQVLESTAISSRTAPIGQGSMVLTVGSQTLDITIDSSNDSLEGLAASINGKGMGVQASIVTDANGARLVLKGATGAASAFTLSVPSGTNSGLERFAFGPGVTGGMNSAQTAQDAIVKLDGVSVSRATNSFSDVIPGVQIDLKKASVPGTTVSLGAQRPTAAIQQGMEDFVAAYNELLSMINTATAAGGNGTDAGALRGDVGVNQMRRQLQGLTSQVLNGAGTGPKTLAEVGVRTNRDGTLSLDSAQLTAMLINNPDGVEALFNPSQTSSNPNVRIMNAIGKVAPGTYTLSDLVPAASGGNASGNVNGQAMTGVGTNLVAPSGSAALGLIVAIDGPVSGNVTITVQPGLGGALKAIRDSLRSTNGAFTTTNKRLTLEKTAISDAQMKLDEQSSKYYDKMLTQFTKMESRVSAYKATQSYLTQQIEAWNSQRS